MKDAKTPIGFYSAIGTALIGLGIVVIIVGYRHLAGTTDTIMGIGILIEASGIGLRIFARFKSREAGRTGGKSNTA